MNNQENHSQPAEEITKETAEEIKNTAQNDHDTTDYVMPPTSFKKHRRSKRRRSAHSTKTKKLSGDDTYEGYVFRSPGKRKKKKTWVKTVIIIIAALLALVMAAAVTVIILREIGKNQLHDYDDIDITIEEDDGVEVQRDGKTIIYNGKTYHLNEDVASVVFIGVDQEMTDDEEKAMSDAIYLFVMDSSDKKATVIPVSRDTMADVDVYSSAGKFINTEKLQLSYAFSYGKDNEAGAENTTAALSKLFFGLPFNNYFAMDLDALLELNDAVGGVTLTSSMTFTSPLDGRTIIEGETVTLYSKEAEAYVRSRDTSKLDSNNARIERQEEYIQAFLKSALPAIRKDLSVVSNLYNTIRVNSVTSLTLPKMTYLASEGVSMGLDPSKIAFKSIPGKITKGEKYAQFNVDETGLLELMLDVFYLPQE